MYRLPSKHLLPLVFLLSAALLPLSPLFAATACMDEFLLNQTVDIRMQTDLGGIDIQLRGDIAPLTVENFCNYVDTFAYDGTFIHRSIEGFVVQGGGWKFDPDDGPFFGGGASKIPTDDPVMNEADLPGALLNVRGTLAMAKGNDPDSATSQWFFNQVDNTFLDYPNSVDGYTVFAEVLDLDVDMAIVDDIAAQDVCSDIPGLGTVVCGSLYEDTVQIGASRPVGLGFVTDNLLVVNYVGIDGDGDGIINRVEDAGPNGGDADNNGTADSLQANLASFDNITGGYAVLKSPDGTALESIGVLSPAYAIGHPPPTFCGFKDFDFSHGFTDIKLTGLSGTTVEVTLELPGGDVPDNFFAFNPELPADGSQWFDFSDNGTTGAVISGSTVTLNFVDGGRGDNDGAINGVIQSVLGPVFNRTVFPDEDGILGFSEDGINKDGPNEGDGNKDGILDSIQAHVASFRREPNSPFLTLESDSVRAPIRVINTNVLTLPFPGPGVLDGLNFAHGFIEYEVCTDTGPGVTVNMILPEGESPDSYYMFGPTPDNPVPHYYEFLFDGTTGAEIVPGSNIVTLHYVDGMRGDSDLDASNGVISDPGGPVFYAPNTSSSGGGGGGCSLSTNTTPWQAGTWWLLLSLISLAGIRRGRRRVSR